MVSKNFIVLNSSHFEKLCATYIYIYLYTTNIAKIFCKKEDWNASKVCKIEKEKQKFKKIERFYTFKVLVAYFILKSNESSTVINKLRTREINGWCMHE